MAEAEISIRRADVADAPALSALARWVWLQTYATDGVRDSFVGYLDQSFAPGTLAHLIQRADQPMWLVHEGQHLVAWAHVAMDRSPPDGACGEGQAELERLYVVPPRAGQGLGARLLRYVRRSLPAHALWLRAWAGNSGALRFYRREGAALMGETWFELEGERHRNEVLAWPAWRDAKSEAA